MNPTLRLESKMKHTAALFCAAATWFAVAAPHAHAESTDTAVKLTDSAQEQFLKVAKPKFQLVFCTST